MRTSNAARYLTAHVIREDYYEFQTCFESAELSEFNAFTKRVF